MLKPVIWSEEAICDLEYIAKYISRDSIYYAQQVVERMISAGESVNVFPESGKTVPELGNKHYREKFIYNYRLIYEIESDTISILAIIHGKKILESDKILQNNKTL